MPEWEKGLVIGSGGVLSIILDLLNQIEKYKIVGLIDCNKPKGVVVKGYEILGEVDEVKNIVDQHDVTGIV
ncbi:MAG: hypothetical protein GY821_07750 [Gammaproteobacteria bacterium]|nr:hypothetical protein [Gammaproteobacteria bacterium]